MRALPAPEPTRRITTHPHSAPLHKIRTDDMLPLQLLTPTQVHLLMNKIEIRDTGHRRLVQRAAAAADAPLRHAILVPFADAANLVTSYVTNIMQNLQ